MQMRLAGFLVIPVWILSWIGPPLAESAIRTEKTSQMSAQKMAPRGIYRILYVSDPSSIAINLLPDPVQEADLRRWVDMVASSGVDIFDQEVYSQGWTAYWRSPKFEYDRRLQHKRFVPMLDAGIQPLDILIDESHKRGMVFIAGFRMNDNHGFQAKQQGVGIASVIQMHPEWNLKDFPSGEYYQSLQKYLLNLIESSIVRGMRRTKKTPTQKDLVSVRSQLRYEKRRTAVEAVRNGESASTVARVMKVPLRTLFSWIARYRLGGEQALQEGRRSGR
ncbi:MAG: helix-turn-helix domain-containing protein, partial [Acidimicrobiia bacterium]|nr:helix-turn-helix domain-containing protein [Acidimicrobiia bacterium]